MFETSGTARAEPWRGESSWLIRGGAESLVRLEAVPHTLGKGLFYSQHWVWCWGTDASREMTRERLNAGRERDETQNAMRSQVPSGLECPNQDVTTDVHAVLQPPLQGWGRSESGGSRFPAPS